MATVDTQSFYNGSPSAGDGTLTIKRNGTVLGTFTAKQSGDTEVDITVPVKTSQLDNDSGFVSDQDYVHTDNNFTDELHSKLEGVESGAQVNVQADWNQTDASAEDYIKNKPLSRLLPETTSSDNGKILTVNSAGTGTEWRSTDDLKAFKGWFDDITTLSAVYPSPKVGDYAYIKGATASDPAAIYECATAGTWTDSGRAVDTSGVQTFESGEAVNQVYIDDTNLQNPTSGSLSKASDVTVLKRKVEGIHKTVITGQGIDSTGKVTASGFSGYSTCEPIPLTNGETFTVKFGTSVGNYARLIFVDENMVNCITGSSKYYSASPNPRTITCNTDNTAYVIFSFLTSTISSGEVWLKKNGKVVFLAQTEVKPKILDILNDFNMIDDVPETGSTNLVISRGVKTKLDGIWDYDEGIENFYKTINTVINTAFDGTPNKIPVTIKDGEHFSVTINTTAVSKIGGITAWYEDSSTESISSNITITDGAASRNYVAKHNIIYISCYATSNNVIATGTVNITVSRTRVLKTIIDSLIAGIDSDSQTAFKLNPRAHQALVSAKSQIANYPSPAENSMLAFAITTDIHGDWTRFRRAIQYANDEPLVDALLNLGDVGDTPTQLRSYDYETDVLKSTKPVLTIPGNHEVSKTTNHTPFSNAEFLAKFYTPDIVALSGDIHDDDSIWWYRDFSHNYQYREDGVTKTGTKYLRVIGINQADYCASLGYNAWYITQEQVDWFVNVLENTPENYHLLVLTHATMENEENLTPVDCKFNSGLKKQTYNNLTNKHFFTNIIRAWINGSTIDESSENSIDSVVITAQHTFSTQHTNKFVCFLSGHNHRDYVSRVAGDEPIYQVNVTCTSASQQQQLGNIGRETTGKMQDAITVFVYDWFRRKIKIIRVGADISCEMKDVNYDEIDLA